MKALLLSFSLCLSTLFVFGQQAPERQWSQVDWPRIDTETGLQVAQENSGEDWWYDHKNTYDANGNQTGYVAAGFNYGIGRITDYDLTDLNNDGYYDGMAYCNANEQEYKLELFEEPGLVRRCGRAMMMAYDLNGKGLWCKSYNEGEFVAVIQTNDGGFLALGYTSTTVNMPDDIQNNYASTSQRPSHIAANNYLYYNPTVGSSLNHFDAKASQILDPITGHHIMTTPNYTRNGRRPFLVKTNANGEVIWNYQYGGYDFATQEDEAFSQKMVWGDLVQNGNGYLFVYSTGIINPPGQSLMEHLKTKSFIISIDANGMVNWKQQVFSNGFAIEAITANYSSGKFAVSGNKQYEAIQDANNTNPFNDKWFNQSVVAAQLSINTNGFSYDWSINGNTYLEVGVAVQNPMVSKQRSKSTDIDYKTNGDIILPYIDACNTCFGAGANFGEGKIALINSTTGSVITTKSIGPCNAYDFKLAVSPTSDGGFALLTSKGDYNAQGNFIPLNSTDPLLVSLYPDLWFNTPGDRTSGLIWGIQGWLYYWNTDTYIVKFDATNNQEWEQKYNVDESPRQAYPGDLKKQECMYAVSQAADGGFVASGNSSHNFDDCLLLKTYPPCQKVLTFEPISIGYDDIRINSSQFWYSDKVIGHNVIIDNNSTLTIDGASIEMGDADQLGRQVRIHVKPGSKLVLKNGAKLTSVASCPGSKWAGILVYGNGNMPQTASLQGTVEIQGTAQNPVIIENAVDAISTHGTVSYVSDETDWNSFGGIIKADYCRFENNLRDVQFMKYNHFENGVWQPNKSYFDHCTFIKDREFVEPRAYRGASVSLWDVQGVTFTACTFDNSALTLEEQNVNNGIYGLDANFTVRWDCPFGSYDPQVGCTNPDSSYFKGMEYGIRAEYTKGFSGPNTKVHGTEFKCTNGLYIGGSYNNIATRNSFYVEKLPAFVYPDIPYGLYFDYATNFTAQENEFYTRGTTGHNAGMVVNNHGSLNQLVYNNTFDDFLLGLSAQGENRSTNNGETGLECRCNDFTLGEYDMFVYGNPNQPWNGIQREQGAYVQNKPELLASNLFSLSGGLYSDYFNLPDYINYHHHDPNYGSNPPNVKPVDVFNVFNHSYPVIYQSCNPIITSGKTSDVWQLEMADAKEAMHNDEALLTQLLNEEENWQLEAEILFASQYGDWYDVYMDMMEQSPYLDHGIIEELINNPDFPDLMLRNIMLANPDAAKAQHLLDLIYLRNMPAWMVADIEEGKSSYGAKEVLVGRIGYNKGVQQNAIAQLLGIYGGSTTYNGLDSAIALLSTREEVTYAYLLADVYLAKGQYTQALTLVNNLPQTHTLSEKEGLDFPAYQSWYTLRAQLAEGNYTWFEVDNTQKATLQTLADTINHNAPMLWANHALKLIGEEMGYREPIYLPNPVSQKTQSPQAARSGNQQNLTNMYPNPASDVVNVIAKGIVKGHVALFDLTGKQVLQTELNYGTAIFHVKNLTPGVYLARIYVDNEELETVKLLVVGE